MSGSSFGKRLRDLRRGFDLTQAALAERAGCSQNMLRKIEADERRPSRALAERLADVLEVAAADRGDFLRDARSTHVIRQRTLPAPLTRLIGRESALRDLRERVLRDDVRLLTLVGPPGVGKTRLALQLAFDVEADFEYGVGFVPLAHVREPRAALEQVLQTLIPSARMSSDLEGMLADYLQRRRTCLVLDNFEQVLSARTHVAELLRRAPALKVVVTSREALAVYGEHVFAVQPLGLPDPAGRPRRSASETLFIERARATRPEFEHAPDAERCIAQICLRLEGLPLSIELAASRARFDSPAELLARLEVRLETLAQGPTDFSTRQSSLRGALDWSYDLLAPDQQRLFGALSVFSGGATREAIEAVCGSARPLEALVDKSLIYVAHGAARSRFAMLEIVREYAQQCVAASDVEALQRRHATYFAAHAERGQDRLRGTTQVAWLEELHDEQANLHAALDSATRHGDIQLVGRLCAALWPFWRARGFFDEGRRWLAAVLEHEGLLTEPIRASVLNGAGVLALLQSDYARASAYLDQSRALYERLGDGEGLGHAISNQGWLAHDRTEYDVAQRLFEDSLRVRRAAGDAWGEAWSLNNLGMVRLERGDLPGARAAFEASVGVFRRLGDLIGLAQALSNLGWVNQELGEYELATRLFEDSLALCRQLEDARGVANNLSNSGLMAIYAGDYRRAHALFVEALFAFHDLGERRGTAEALEGVAGVAGVQGRAEEAARLFGHAEMLREQIGAPLLPTDRSRYEAMLDAAREQVAADTWTKAWADGRTVTLDALLHPYLHS